MTRGRSSKRMRQCRRRRRAGRSAQRGRRAGPGGEAALAGLLDAVAAGALGRVERAVGAAQQRRRGLDAVPLPRCRPSRSGRRASRPPAGARTASAPLAVGAGEQDGELLAAEARQLVAGPQLGAPGGGAGEQQRSPAPWPCSSLNALKWSRSRTPIANGSSRRPAAASSSQWSHARRLPAPVSASVSAWRSSWATAPRTAACVRDLGIADEPLDGLADQAGRRACKSAAVRKPATG